MTNMQIDLLLDQLRRQSYPLEVTKNAADALLQCISRIMQYVPEDDQLLVRADYDAATSALYHPDPAL